MCVCVAFWNSSNVIFFESRCWKKLLVWARAYRSNLNSQRRTVFVTNFDVMRFWLDFWLVPTYARIYSFIESNALRERWESKLNRLNQFWFCIVIRSLERDSWASHSDRISMTKWANERREKKSFRLLFYNNFNRCNNLNSHLHTLTLAHPPDLLLFVYLRCVS